MGHRYAVGAICSKEFPHVSSPKKLPLDSPRVDIIQLRKRDLKVARPGSASLGVA